MIHNYFYQPFALLSAVEGWGIERSNIGQEKIVFEYTMSLPYSTLSPGWLPGRTFFFAYIISIAYCRCKKLAPFIQRTRYPTEFLLDK